MARFVAFFSVASAGSLPDCSLLRPMAGCTGDACCDMEFSAAKTQITSLGGASAAELTDCEIIAGADNCHINLTGGDDSCSKTNCGSSDGNSTTSSTGGDTTTASTDGETSTTTGASDTTRSGDGDSAAAASVVAALLAATLQ